MNSDDGNLAENEDPQSMGPAGSGDYRKRKIMWVKKSLKDPTAALSYALSVSILHLAMLAGWFMKKGPNMAATKGMA